MTEIKTREGYVIYLSATGVVVAGHLPKVPAELVSGYCGAPWEEYWGEIIGRRMVGTYHYNFQSRYQSDCDTVLDIFLVARGVRCEHTITQADGSEPRVVCTLTKWAKVYDDYNFWAGRSSWQVISNMWQRPYTTEDIVSTRSAIAGAVT